MADVWADLLTDVAVLGTNSDWPKWEPLELTAVHRVLHLLKDRCQQGCWRERIRQKVIPTDGKKVHRHGHRIRKWRDVNRKSLIERRREQM